jgi:hypothetical protein
MVANLPVNLRRASAIADEPVDRQVHDPAVASARVAASSENRHVGFISDDAAVDRRHGRTTGRIQHGFSKNSIFRDRYRAR